MMMPDLGGGGVVVGVGIDVVSIERFAAAATRTSSLLDRLFSPEEQDSASGAPRGIASLAARFAAKEAVAKALGVPRGMRWHDCRVASEPSGRPFLITLDSVAEAARAAGVRSWQISLSHDGGMAAAVVVALG